MINHRGANKVLYVTTRIKLHAKNIRKKTYNTKTYQKKKQKKMNRKTL